MIKKIFLIVSLFLVSGFQYATSCVDRQNNLFKHLDQKLQHPELKQVIKNEINENHGIPLVAGAKIIQTNDPDINLIEFIQKNQSLMSGKFITIKHKEYPQIIIIPIQSPTSSYIAGFVVIGYKEVVDINKLETTINLTQIYFKRLLNKCD